MNPAKKALVGVATGGVALTIGVFIPMPDEPSLGAYQARCANALATFITQIPKIDRGQYAVTFGEAFRPQSVAAAYARQGIGIANSLHTQRLAIDLNLFIDGKFQTSTEAHKPLADLWLALGKQMGVEPAAGYYFNDGNHYSCAYGGRK